MPHSETGQVFSNKKTSVDHENKSKVKLWTKEKSDLARIKISLV